MFAPVLLAATLVTGGSPPSWNLPISDMRDRLVAESLFIRAIGVNPSDYIFRLDYLRGRLQRAGTEATPERADLDAEARLELKLDSELLINRCPVFAGVVGIDESWYNDDPKAPPDPVAFYLPKPGPSGRYAMVIVLHNRLQTETDVISRAVFRDLADRTHAILVAPWGTGSELWGAPAANEVLAIAAEMERGFPIDPKHVYLAGVGLGGSGALHFAAEHPQAFRAVLDAGGDVDSSDFFLLSHGYRNGTLYVVGAGRTFSAFSRTCSPLSFYSVDPARSDFYQSSDQIKLAWTDMFDGVVRNTSTFECTPF